MTVARLAVLLVWIAAGPLLAQGNVEYRVSFPEAGHHRVDVEVTFTGVPAGTLAVHMSQTSPGRYALHEFAKNVYAVRADNGAGQPLPIERSSPSQWNVSGHSGTVRVRYKVFGDRLDGTFLSVDATHAHMNIPASLMWARGLEDRPVRIAFDAPTDWKIATQLHATDDPRVFTAANLQYLADSPTELSAFVQRTFTVDREFRIALHHDGTDRDADRFTADLERIVREARAVFGEFPSFEVPYTFIADYLPWASDDAMEHRNSTILTSPSRIRVPDERVDLLGTAAHEFFHSWNVERIRPLSLEPFELDAPNPSGELWFGEGFTHYYQPLLMRRTSLWSDEQFAARIGELLDRVTRSPARKYNTPEDVSRLAQYVDQAAWIDPTNFGNHFLSYYDWGSMIAMGLDLSLRGRSGGAVTLDHYMRRLWQEFGRAAAAEGTVARPYTTSDLRRVLADVSGDAAFAQDFFARYIQGRDVVDYTALLARAGFVLRRRNPGRPWIGPVALRFGGGGGRVTEPTLEDTPAYAAGIDLDDEVLAIDGAPITSADRLDDVIRNRTPGDRVRVSIRRRGAARELTLTIGDDPTLEVVSVERTGRGLTQAERAFRERWLGSQQ